MSRRAGLLVAAAGIETFLIDTGIDDQRLCSPADVAAMGGGTAYEVVRLEALAEELLTKGAEAPDFAQAVEQRCVNPPLLLRRASPRTGWVSTCRRNRPAATPSSLR